MTLATPIHYAPDIEKLADDEAETVAALNRAFDTILETTAADYGQAVRAVHAKGHGLIDGELEIFDDLPPELAQGLFATPGRHKVIMRMSTNAGDILPDAISLPRGLAIKVLDVEGERLPGAEGQTQDFIMVNGTVFQAKTAGQFAGNLKLLAKTTDKAEGSKVVLSGVLRSITAALGAVGVEVPALNSLGGAPNVDPLGETYHSTTPFRYGDYLAKFSVAPVAPTLTELTGSIIDARGRPDAIRERVQEEMAQREGVWEFRVQLCRDLAKQPIEDPTVEWDEGLSPFLPVGRITAARQDSWSAAKVAAIDEGLRFSVWTGLAAHRPLGNINRARRDTYEHSAQFRARTTGCPLHEPGAAALAR